MWLKLVALTVLIGALVFAFTANRQTNANAAALDKAHATLQAAMAKLRSNRTDENSKEVQKALNAYRALGGTESLAGSMMLSAPQSSRAVAFAVSRPVSQLPAAIQPGQNVVSGKDIVRGKKNEFPVKTTNPAGPGDTDPKIQSVAKPGQNTLNIPAPIVNFEGLNGDGNIPIFGGRVLPPDTVGDVGPNHYVQSVNTLFRVFDKTGAALTPVMTLGSLWATIPGACANANDGDPIVLYDPLADRWLISQFCTVANPNNHQIIAISTTPDPTGTYYLYDFMMPNNKFNDYPHFGVWPDGYYMSDNQFNQAGTAFLGAGAFAFDRKKMLQGDPTASFVYFDIEPIDPNAGGLLPTDLDGVATPPVGMPNVFMEFRADDFGDPLDAIRPYEFHVDFATPANSTFTVRPDVALAAFDARNPGGRADIEQPAGGFNLDSIADRLMHRLAYRTLAGGTQSFVLNFSVNVSGVNPTSAANYQAGVRWTELRRTGTSAGTITVNNEGTYAPGAGNGATGRNIWMASVAQDYLGNIGLGFSASSTTLFPSILYAGRLTGDPAGLLSQGENTIITGAGVQTSTSSRWGDYSNMSVDPVDETTFWYTQEYYQVTSGADWRTRIGSFKVDTGAPAQSKGTINGTVTNCATMAAIPGVVIMTADGFFRQSDASGNFTFPVAPGTYSVMVIPPPGFSGGCTQSVTVAGGGTATVNCCLTPVPVIAAMGSSLTAESCQPANGVVDPGETVTVDLGVKNTGLANTVSLVGTLSATGGVTSPSGPQNYGV
ncbi:MAG: carboxypeptidase-like regulatory domain-containing protein, partial [Acidobacteriota bacterium]